jgi:glycosyltransferase involved in cell wall biosynthesis
MIAVEPLNLSSNAGVERGNLPHVLLVLDQFQTAMGGGERIALKLASLLPEYGFRASILTFFIHPESAVLNQTACPVYLLPLERVYDLTALKAALDLRHLLIQKNVRIVQTFFESSDLWAGLVTKAASSAKLVWARRDMGILRSRKHDIAYRLMAGAPDAVFAVSEQVRRHCIDVDGIDPARVHTVYNGLDPADWDTAMYPSEAPREVLITSVGNIRRVKGHDVFIRAAAKVVPYFPEVKFSVAGEVLEPAYFQELQALVQDLNLTEHFHFVGGISDLRRHLAAADIFVLPSRSEGFSNAVIEAMAVSLPVVATRVGGNAEAVEDGVSGLLIPPEDPAALADSIIWLLCNPQPAREMGAAGKRIVFEKFSTQKMVNLIVGRYRKLLAT